MTLHDAPVEVLGDAAERPGFTLGEDGKVNGTTGLNLFHGQLDPEALRADRFLAGPLASTRRAGPPELMEREQRFLAALQQADIEVSAETLILRRDGAVLAVLERAP